MILVDTNIILDVLTADLQWRPWSAEQIKIARSHGDIAVNPVVFAELCVRSSDIRTVKETLEDFGLVYLDIPRPALFLAAKAFAAYRDRGGPRQSVLPDFFVGAHALAEDMPLLTRDPRRYRTAFPTLAIIAP